MRLKGPKRRPKVPKPPQNLVTSVGRALYLKKRYSKRRKTRTGQFGPDGRELYNNLVVLNEVERSTSSIKSVGL